MVAAKGHLAATSEDLEDIFNDALISSTFIKCEPYAGKELMALLLKLPFHLTSDMCDAWQGSDGKKHNRDIGNFRSS